MEKHVERINKGPFTGEYVVMLDPSIWGKLAYDRFFWGLPNNDGEQPGFIQPTEDGLEITGESNGHPVGVHGPGILNIPRTLFRHHQQHRA